MLQIRVKYIERLSHKAAYLMGINRFASMDMALSIPIWTFLHPSRSAKNPRTAASASSRLRTRNVTFSTGSSGL